MRRYCFWGAAAIASVWIGAGPAVAITKLSQSFDQWQVNCVTDAKKNKVCAVAFSLVNKKLKQIVFSFSVNRSTADPKAKIVIRTITGVLLPGGINLTLPATDPIKVDYRTCGPRACVSEFELSDNWLKALSENDKLVVEYRLANSEPIKHDIILKSFRTAYDFMIEHIEKQD